MGTHKGCPYIDGAMSAKRDGFIVSLPLATFVGGGDAGDGSSGWDIGCLGGKCGEVGIKRRKSNRLSTKGRR